MFTNNMAGSEAESSVSKLPASTVRLIGSGQVITSVFSVVKELFENSVDASSTTIDIKLDDFGLEKIEVCDNGKGVSKADVPFMAKRHFTSKLTAMDDFITLETYGFRGEALASLCSVSDVSIITKTKEDDVGTAYSFDDEGNIKDSKPSHLGTGTTVTARHLFQNLPVRKQYYKTSQRKKEDLRKVEDLLIAFSIIKPKLRIKLKHGSEIVFQKLPMSDTKSVLHAVLGRQITNQLLQREQSLSELQGSVTTFIPKPGTEVKIVSRATSDRTYIAVNDRPVEVKELIRLLKRYYMNCHACESARYPISFVSIKLPIPDVDVNLDPNKSTVLLRPMSEVCNTLEEILLQVYGPLDNIPPWHYIEASDNKTSESKNKSENSTKAPNIDAQNNNLKTLKTAQAMRVVKSGDEMRVGCHGHKDAHSSAHPNMPAQPTLAKTETNCKELGNAELIFPDDDLLLLDALGKDFTQASKNKENAAVVESLPLIESRAEETCNGGESVLKSSNSNHIVTNLNATEVSKEPSACPLSHASNWSKGCALVGSAGQTIQPVELLAPTSNHTPGKRPLSPTSQELNKPPSKQRSSSSLSWNPPMDQPTLPGMVSSPVLQSSSAGSSTEREHSTIGVSKGPRVQDTKPMQLGKKDTLYKTCLRDQVAAQASQSQAEKTKKSLKNRLYHAERKLPCVMQELSQAVVEREQNYDRVLPQNPIVLGRANHCDAWFCSLGSRVCVFNIHRLTEFNLYKKLRAKHKLPASPLEQSIPLNSRNLNDSQLALLDKLREESRAQESFEITEKRLVDNGFDLKCFYDASGAFSVELYGICNLIPTYNIDDLREVLNLIIKDPSSDLASVRPNKVLYYLQGEAARMAQQNSSPNSRQEAQEMINQLDLEEDQLRSENCIHHKPIVSFLFNLNELSPDHILL